MKAKFRLESCMNCPQLSLLNSKDQHTITSFTQQTVDMSLILFHSKLGNVLFSHLTHFLCLLHPLILLWSPHWEVETVPGLRSLSGGSLDLFNWQAIRNYQSGGHFSDGATTSCKILSSDFDARRTWRNWTINKQRILSTTKMSPRNVGSNKQKNCEVDLKDSTQNIPTKSKVLKPRSTRLGSLMKHARQESGHVQQERDCK